MSPRHHRTQPLTRLGFGTYKGMMRSRRGSFIVLLASGVLWLPASTGYAHRAPDAQARQAPAGGDIATLRANGEAAMDASRFEDAEAIFEKLVGLTPADPIARLQLGMARTMSGRAAEAIAPLREALRLRPDLLPAKLFLGIAYMEVNRPKDAVAPLRQVVQADGSNVNARQALAEALLALEQFGEASVQLEAVTKAQPALPQVWAALGRTYEGISRAAFARLQEIDPDSPYVWLLVADVMVVEEKHAQAFDLIRKAQEALPTLPGVHRQLATVYAASGHADWAAVEQQRADAEKPACATVPVACAYLAGKYRDVITRTATATQATALYWRARAANDLAIGAFGTLEQLPPSVDRFVVRAGIARDQGQPLEAAAQLREALKLAPGDPGLERDLAGALYASGDVEQALPLLEKLLASNPNAPDLLIAVGDGLLRGTQVERAVTLLKKAVSLDPSQTAAQGLLGRALLQAGDAAGSIPHLEAALAADQDGSVHYQLAQAVQRTGNAERAKVLLAEYQKRAEAAAPPEPVSPASAPTITPPVP